jgi:hypothetical protein
MSDNTTRISFGGIICAKLAGLAGFPAWSWWWLLMPIVPVITELLKLAFGK